MLLSELADRILIPISMDTDHALREVVMDLIIDARALVIKQDSRRKLQDSELYLQDTGYINLVPAYEIEDCDYESCDVLRTEYEIPDPIRAFHTPFYQVYDSSTLYDYVRRFSRTQYRVFSKNAPQYYWDKYIYIQNKPTLRKIRVQGIFYDPRELAIFSTCDGSAACNLDEEDFPMAHDAIERVVQIVLNRLSMLRPQDNEIKLDESQSPSQ